MSVPFCYSVKTVGLFKRSYIVKSPNGGLDGSSKHGGVPPELTSRSRDINKHGGGVKELLICS
jgi:hypothetical protein